jgi:hypothetical protein
MAEQCQYMLQVQKEDKHTIARGIGHDAKYRRPIRLEVVSMTSIVSQELWDSTINKCSRCAGEVGQQQLFPSCYTTMQGTKLPTNAASTRSYHSSRCLKACILTAEWH